ncbi:MAG: hypothetical protein B1H05_00785 [Candidatus Cloacimonas sp. 4484_140]|nr:MAG: hypothetical protein B1H05_00785 [Candidatus Cloacimonas sp. 4484_140]
MNKKKLNKEIEKQLIAFLVNAGARKIGIFGSYAQGTADTSSDIDLLVEFVNIKSLLELVKIERELSELIKMKIDLLTENSISPFLIDRIKAEEQVIYEN